MVNTKVRAWWFHKQGLDRGFHSPEEVLAQAGWARSVGSSNPYLTFFSRGISDRAEMEQAALAKEIQELPCARGCTYIVPKEDFAVALGVGRGTSEAAAMRTAVRHLGVTEAEVDRLAESVLAALEDGPLDPKELKGRLGDVVRHLGEEGKKRGQTTTLPLALGRLQATGMVRRIPVDGRLDHERYRYSIWRPSPGTVDNGDNEKPHVGLARRYWAWIGPAKLAHFQWFSGLSGKSANEAVDYLQLTDIGDGWLLPESELEEFYTFEAPKEPVVKLVASLDSLLLLRRDVQSLIEESDLSQRQMSESGLIEIGGVMDLAHHAIVDRGRIIGFWEFDPQVGEICWRTFGDPGQEVTDAVAKTETFVRDQLGDARSFSLDSPKSRMARLAFLREPSPVPSG